MSFYLNLTGNDFHSKVMFFMFAFGTCSGGASQDSHPMNLDAFGGFLNLY